MRTHLLVQQASGISQHANLGGGGDGYTSIKSLQLRGNNKLNCTLTQKYDLRDTNNQINTQWTLEIPNGLCSSQL